jgi:tetrahydromethanopterin S-methyltransferase subunit F
MTYLLRDVLRSLRASPIFAFYVLATLVVAGRNGLITWQPELMGMPGMVHFGVPQHRIHDLTFGFLFTTSVVGVLAQLRRPSKNVAGMLMALIPWVGLLLAAFLSF